MDTVAIPQALHWRRIQFTAVPVKLRVTVAPDTSELPAVPPLKAATSGPRRTQEPVGLTAALFSSKRGTGAVPLETGTVAPGAGARVPGASRATPGVGCGAVRELGAV